MYKMAYYYPDTAANKVLYSLQFFKELNARSHAAIACTLGPAHVLRRNRFGEPRRNDEGARGQCRGRTRDQPHCHLVHCLSLADEPNRIALQPGSAPSA